MKPIRVIGLLATALVMGLTCAHVLEMPVKLALSAAQWTTLQHTLYRWFAVSGGPLEVVAVAVGIVWAVRDVRRRSVAVRSIAGAVFLVVGLLEWAIVVQRANGEVATWIVGKEPADWESWRIQWELGHLAHFVLFALAFLALLLSALRAAESKR